MKKTIIIMFTLALFTFATSPLMAHAKTIVVQLKGKAEGFIRNVPSPDRGQIEALCFKVPMFDVPTGLQLGTALDCLSDVKPNEDDPPRVALIDTTIFRFPRNGRLVSYGHVAIEPINNPNEAAPASTHITGSVPLPETKNIITRAGTKRFHGRTGSVRLSGAVNMSEFNLNPGEPIVFNCLFVIQLDGGEADDFESLGDLDDSSEDEADDLALAS